MTSKSVAVIGAGPSGLIAAKYLQAEKAFDKIAVFEQSSTSGGLWNYTGDQTTEDLFQVPQTGPQGCIQDPTWECGDEAQGRSGVNGTTNGHTTKAASFLSAIYERLETNIPRGLMGFQDLDWPENSQLFPQHEAVLRYIRDYGREVQDLVQYETQVTKIEVARQEDDSSWTVTTRNVRSNEVQSEIFDAVIVASGHYTVPNIPSISGLAEFHAHHPDAITHSKYFRRPEAFSGKKVLVIGNSASGSDISTQISQFSSPPLLWSSRSSSMFTPAVSNLKREVPEVTAFLPASRGVRFSDGTAEHNIDAILFATGYFYSLPFLSSIKPPLITDGSHVNHTYKHLFFRSRPTLSFLALPQRVIPFPLAEAQAAVVARVYSGRLSLPSQSAMYDWERKVEEEMGNGRNFHLLPFPKDADYINEMSAWAMSAKLKAGLENGGQGKRPPVWGAKEYWVRERFPAIRKAFVALGDERSKAKTLRDVGYTFENSQRHDHAEARS